MKKTFLFSMALVAAFSSCTKDNVDNINENNDLVAIKLGAGMEVDAAVAKKASRAALTSDTWVGTNVKLFALAKDADAWNDDPNPDTDPVVLWNNITGEIQSGETSQPISITDGQDAAKYYPKTGTHNYSFFGFYPESEIVAVGADDVTVTYTITGAEDIIYGNAVAPTLSGPVEGYNAKYFNSVSATAPSITFGHFLTQLNFQFKRQTNHKGEQTIQVTKVELLEQPTVLDLKIADRTDANFKGTITPNAEPLSGILEVGGFGTAQDITQETYVKKGESIMIFTAANGINDDGVGATNSYKVKITIDDGDPLTTPTAVETTINAPADPGYFERGKAYNVNLEITDLVTIEVNATLTDWGTPTDIDAGSI